MRALSSRVGRGIAARRDPFVLGRIERPDQPYTRVDLSAANIATVRRARVRVTNPGREEFDEAITGARPCRREERRHGARGRIFANGV